MNSPFPFDAVLVFCFLSVMLLVGIALRAYVPWIQRYLFPSCLVGGILAMVLMNTGLVTLPFEQIESFAYHFFNVSFISVGLTASEGQAPGEAKDSLKGSLWMALVQGVTFPLQAIIGGLAVIGFGLIGIELFPTFGFLAPLGFNEGPGQALAFGKVWEGLGFQHGATIGLTFATFGFLFAFFVGVPLVNAGLRRRGAGGEINLSRDFLRGILHRDSAPEAAGRLTTYSANVETLALHVALVGLVYLLTYGFVHGLQLFIPADVGKILWGFAFLFGMVIAMGVRQTTKAIGLDYIIDPRLQSRITGLSVDYLIVATGAAVQLGIVWQYALPISVISILCGVTTTIAVLALGSRLPSHRLERIAAIYGTTTGTVSCGLLLLRMVDPQFKTPAAKEIASMNIFAVPVIGGLTFLVNGPLKWGWSVGATVGVFALALVASVFLMLAFGVINRRGAA